MVSENVERPSLVSVKSSPAVLKPFFRSKNLPKKRMGSKVFRIFSGVPEGFIEPKSECLFYELAEISFLNYRFGIGVEEFSTITLD